MLGALISDVYLDCISKYSRAPSLMLVFSLELSNSIIRMLLFGALVMWHC